MYGLLVILGAISVVVASLSSLYLWSQLGMLAGLFALFQTLVLMAILLCIQWIVETLGNLDAKFDAHKIEREQSLQTITDKMSVPNHEILQKLYDLENSLQQVKAP